MGAASRRVIGVTGPICGGKSTVSALLEEEGCYSIDVDLLGHKALEEKRAELLARFGTSILGADGAIDRRSLGKIVFADGEALRSLEAIVHPWMRSQVGEIIFARADEHICINAAVLFTMELHPFCDGILWVDAPVLTRLARLRRRNGLGILEGLRRIWSQRSLRAQHSMFRSDIYHIWNSGRPEELAGRIRRFLDELGM